MSLIPAPEPARLEPLWTELERRAGGSVFTSWDWIGRWLARVRDRHDVRLLRVDADGRPAGLGLFVARRLRRNGVVPVRQLLLHATGDPETDELTIEYNGLLAERGLEAEVTRAAFGHLAEHEPWWDECLVDGADLAHGLEGLAAAGTRVLATRRSRCFGVDLARAGAGPFVETLAGSTRSSVRRSARDFAKKGAVTLREPSSTQEALVFLAALRELHQAYWRSRGEPGSFAGGFFRSFHEQLVCEGFATGRAQLLQLRAGDVVVGYTYNLVHGGRVYQYSSGFDYGVVPARSPGLLAHVLSVEHYAARGQAVYDMMAGESRYKQELGSPVGEVAWLVLRRRRLKFRLEDAARSVRDRLRPAAASAPEPAQGEPS